MQLIERANYQPMPWKNGAGITMQIAIYPADATIDNFDWRISTAVVTADGPFSGFPGLERTLAVLEGAGINLTIGGTQAERLTPTSAPFTFPADASANATLINGPIHDLNVMARQDRFNHSVRKLTGQAVSIPAFGTIVVFAQSTGLQIDDGVQSIRIKLGDTAIFDAGTKSLNIAPESCGDYYFIELTKISLPGSARS
jgi:environmental stress-induced protein Ves